MAQGLLGEVQEGRPAMVPGAATADLLHQQEKVALDAARRAQSAMDQAVHDAGGRASLRTSQCAGGVPRSRAAVGPLSNQASGDGLRAAALLMPAGKRLRPIGCPAAVVPLLRMLQT